MITKLDIGFPLHTFPFEKRMPLGTTNIISNNEILIANL
jgi:hypothetical protein